MLRIIHPAYPNFAKSVKLRRPHRAEQLPLTTDNLKSERLSEYIWIFDLYTHIKPCIFARNLLTISADTGPMSTPPSKQLTHAVDAYIAAPTRDKRDALIIAADDYRDAWILAQSKSMEQPAGNTATPRSLGTAYDRVLEVVRVVDGVPVKLALQQRTSKALDAAWWTLSWRTKYKPGGSNRRFYFTKDGCWSIPATIALEMIKEMEGLGGLDEKYFDHRRRPTFETLESSQLLSSERAKALSEVTGAQEDWGQSPLFVITKDPNDHWKKVMIVNTDNGAATFRSITDDPEYMPKKDIRPGEPWWLDNSMMDANIQQMRAFYSSLRTHLEQ